MSEEPERDDQEERRLEQLEELEEDDPLPGLDPWLPPPPEE
jgi:hypothetical protein